MSFQLLQFERESNPFKCEFKIGEQCAFILPFKFVSIQWAFGRRKKFTLYKSYKINAISIAKVFKIAFIKYWCNILNKFCKNKRTIRFEIKQYALDRFRLSRAHSWSICRIEHRHFLWGIFNMFRIGKTRYTKQIECWLPNQTMLLFCNMFTCLKRKRHLQLKSLHMFAFYVWLIN